MRNSGRIDPLLRLLNWLWKASPDLRLGQLLTVLAAHEDIFYLEDDDLAATVLASLKEKGIRHYIDYPFFPNRRWWLISDEDIDLIRKGLELIEGVNLADSFERGVAEDTLHALDTGLHKTEAVPEDFQNA